MSDPQSDALKTYTRRCLCVLAAVVCGTLLMVTASFVPPGHGRINIVMVLAAACVNAGLVAGFLMHLISEKKLVYTVLIFTVIFFIGLMGLTLLAHSDVPLVKGT